MRYLVRLTWFTTSVFLIGVFLAAGAGRVDAQESARIALVIGNSAYKFAPPLPNPVNDAKLIAETLRGLGFDVIERIDADRELTQPFPPELRFAEFAERRRDTAKGTGIMGDATAATAQKGKRIFDLACERLGKLAREYHRLPVRHYREFGSHCP